MPTMSRAHNTSPARSPWAFASASNSRSRGPGTSPRTGPADGSPDGTDGTSFLEVAQSVAAGFIGVQSSRNRERDFTRGRPLHFVVGGLVGTALFLLAVYLFVRVLLATA